MQWSEIISWNVTQPTSKPAPTYHQDLKRSERMIRVSRVHVRKLELHKFLVGRVISQSQMYHNNDCRQGDFTAILLAKRPKGLHNLHTPQSVDLLLWSRSHHFSYPPLCWLQDIDLKHMTRHHTETTGVVSQEMHISSSRYVQPSFNCTDRWFNNVKHTIWSSRKLRMLRSQEQFKITIILLCMKKPHRNSNHSHLWVLTWH